jgi:hypothetical protein
VTFVQPSTVFTPPGAVARFGVLAPQAPTREREPASPAWAVGGALALFLAAIYPLIHRKKLLSC